MRVRRGKLSPARHADDGREVSSALLIDTVSCRFEFRPSITAKETLTVIGIRSRVIDLKAPTTDGDGWIRHSAFIQTLENHPTPNRRPYATVRQELYLKMSHAYAQKVVLRHVHTKYKSLAESHLDILLVDVGIGGPTTAFWFQKLDSNSRLLFSSRLKFEEFFRFRTSKGQKNPPRITSLFRTLRCSSVDTLLLKNAWRYQVNIDHSCLRCLEVVKIKLLASTRNQGKTRKKRFNTSVDEQRTFVEELSQSYKKKKKSRKVRLTQIGPGKVLSTRPRQTILLTRQPYT
ncbi:hypothetical protein EVAR_97172_1 [Eumeta japonica]|uniref:Uncharacterized protein n=1 Tax=Eumeta variegata TaxID=151549 RepID=A0A4C1XST3_EUMVA|nr:hypothetical protein EVAR_97172_1 [Eumeta japonica]